MGDCSDVDAWWHLMWHPHASEPPLLAHAFCSALTPSTDHAGWEAAAGLWWAPAPEGMQNGGKRGELTCNGAWVGILNVYPASPMPSLRALAPATSPGLHPTSLPTSHSSKTTCHPRRQPLGVVACCAAQCECRFVLRWVGASMHGSCDNAHSIVVSKQPLFAFLNKPSVGVPPWAASRDAETQLPSSIRSE